MDVIWPHHTLIITTEVGRLQDRIMHHHGAINPLSVLFIGSDLLQGTVQFSMAVDAVVAPVVIVMRSKNSPFFNFVSLNS